MKQRAEELRRQKGGNKKAKNLEALQDLIDGMPTVTGSSPRQCIRLSATRRRTSMPGPGTGCPDLVRDAGLGE